MHFSEPRAYTAATKTKCMWTDRSLQLHVAGCSAAQFLAELSQAAEASACIPGEKCAGRRAELDVLCMYASCLITFCIALPTSSQR